MARDAEGPLERLAAIWTAYLHNELDDEARRWWGPDGNETYNVLGEISPEKVEIYQGRGGRELLTLADCRDAWLEVRRRET